jgi:hypothetical protein
MIRMSVYLFDLGSNISLRIGQTVTIQLVDIEQFFRCISTKKPWIFFVSFEQLPYDAWKFEKKI